MWTRKLTWPGRTPDDWLVLRDGVSVGRVYLTTLRNPTRDVWVWFRQVGHGRNGEAPTLQEALEAVRAAVLAEERG